MDNLDIFLDSLIRWIGETVRSNLIFGLLVAAIMAALGVAAWWIIAQ